MTTETRIRVKSPERYWTKKRTLAAQLIAEGVALPTVYAQTGRSHQWIAECKHEPMFIERVSSLQEEMRRALLSAGIADKAERIRRYEELWGQVDEWHQAHGMTEITMRFDEEGNEVARTERLNAALVQAKALILKAVEGEIEGRAGIAAAANNVAVSVINIIHGNRLGF